MVFTRYIQGFLLGCEDMVGMALLFFLIFLLIFFGGGRHFL